MDERQELFDLWMKHGTNVESDSSEGWELVDAILAAGYRKIDALADEAHESARLGAASGRTIDDLQPSLIDGAGYWLRAKARRLRRG